jgi:NhaA family Na+:H+ antiporter
MNRRPSTLLPLPPLSPRLLAPILRFLGVEATGGVLLLGAAAIALAWANSPWAAVYTRLWHTELPGIDGFLAPHDLLFWVNEGLMTVFFLVVGLEIRRELHEGVLASPRIAALPVLAALGGVITPAVLYLLVNREPAARNGWAVPTTTDIAFAVGVLSLIGGRVPASLRMLLLTLAIVDDIAAILIIAFFYSAGVEPTGLLIAAGGALSLLLLQRAGITGVAAYALPGAAIWYGLLDAGVHPTLAGVILGLMTPVSTPDRGARPNSFSRALQQIGMRLRLFGERKESERAPTVGGLKVETLSPCTRLQTTLHPWVAYLIMPLFALANAGVGVSGVSFDSSLALRVGAGIVAGLVLGKPVGILIAATLGLRSGVSLLPAGINTRHLLLLGYLGGVGFTMSMFICNLAFPDQGLLSMAKLAVLCASAISATIGVAVGRLTLQRRTASG